MQALALAGEGQTYAPTELKTKVVKDYRLDS
jgi:hypothetical protein